MAFVEQRLARLDDTKSAMNQAAVLLKERRSALITAAVTGQINMECD